MQDIPAIIKALEFAAHKHRDQRRKDAEASPYINHPIALASVLANEAGVTDVEVICGALLHDTIEDTETTSAELEAAFGPTIRDIVLEVTDDKRLPSAERKRLQIEHAAQASRKARLVKLADKICNLRDIASSPPANWSRERKCAYFDWAKAVVDQIRGTHATLEALFDAACVNRPREDGRESAPGVTDPSV
jgi:guanosine-3',5'-bis(diphosphate) 3'-pyrophosphohydrolase